MSAKRPLKIAAVGETAGGAGLATAADLALAGHVVGYAPLPGQTAPLQRSVVAQGVVVAGEPARTFSGKVGRARVTWESDLETLCEKADVVMLTCGEEAIETCLELLVPALAADQIVHLNAHSCWGAFRAWPILTRLGRRDVTICEAVAPLAAYDWRDGEIVSLNRRSNLQFAAFPASRSQWALDLVAGYCPDMRHGRNVLETSLANINLLVHPAVAMLNAGLFDLQEEAGEASTFYRSGMTAHAERLTLAHDEERLAVCGAVGVAADDIITLLHKTYGAPTDGLRRAIGGCPLYTNLPPMKASIWRDWISADLRFSHTGLFAVARLAKIDIPLYRSMDVMFRSLLPEINDGAIADLSVLGALDTLDDLQRLVRDGA